jgi:hypothetical protein
MGKLLCWFLTKSTPAAPERSETLLTNAPNADAARAKIEPLLAIQRDFIDMELQLAAIGP